MKYLMRIAILLFILANALEKALLIWKQWPVI